MKTVNDRMHGYTFSSMSDSFLLECFDEVSVKTATKDEFLDQWAACKGELLVRLAKLRQLEVKAEAGK